MILNGYIGADTRSKTYVTAEEGDFAMPVMCWLITHKDKYYLWVSSRSLTGAISLLSTPPQMGALLLGAAITQIWRVQC